jgi:endo-1,4-beta-xylanase
MRTTALSLFLLTVTMATADRIKDVYAGDFPMGMAVSAARLKDGNPAYADFITRHFSVITGENAFKWESLQPQEDRFDFREADRIADFARENGLKLLGHALIWHLQTPDWVFEEDGKPAPPELLKKRINEHIHTVVGRYRDVIYGWDVVNEALSVKEDEYLRPSKWFSILGEEYIEFAFRCASAADPDMLLFYNDFGLADPVKRDKLERLIKGLQEKGVPIHGVGLQSHHNIYYPPVEEIRKSLEMVAGLGLPVAISELDLSVYDFKDKAFRYEEGLPREIDVFHGFRYAEMMLLFREYPELIERVTFWDAFDATNWLSNHPVEGRKDYAGLIDRENNPKAAFHAVMDPERFIREFGPAGKFRTIEAPETPCAKDD